MIRERALRVALVLVGLLFTSAIYPVATDITAWGCVGYRRYDDDEPLFHPGDLPVVSGPQTIGAPQRDRFCRLVELCSCGGHVGAWIPA